MFALLAGPATVEAARPQPPGRVELPPSPLWPLDQHSGAFDPLNWGSAAEMSVGRYLLAGAAHYGLNTCRFYAIGGTSSTGSIYYNTVEAYDPQGNIWEARAALPVPTGGIQAATIGDNIYVPGGYQLGIPVRTHYVYNVSTNSWSTAADLPIPLATAGVATVNNKIYVVGGDDAVAPSNRTTYEYDPSSNTWAQKADMWFARENNVALGLDGKIYVAGGLEFPNLTGLRVFEVYNPATNQWTILAEMNQRRASPGIATDGAFIYVYGGMESFGGGAIWDTAERYDPSTNTWTMLDGSMVRAAVGPASVFLAGRIWAAGGQSFGGQDLRDNQYLEVAEDECRPSSVNLTHLSAGASPTPLAGPVLWLPLALLVLVGGLALLRWK